LQVDISTSVWSPDRVIKQVTSLLKLAGIMPCLFACVEIQLGTATRGYHRPAILITEAINRDRQTVLNQSGSATDAEDNLR